MTTKHISGTMMSVCVRQCSNTPQTICMPEYHITGGFIKVVFTDVHGDIREINNLHHVRILYDPEDAVYTVQTDQGTVYTKDFSHDIIPATRRVLCGYVGRVNFQLARDDGDDETFSDMRAVLADTRVAKTVLLSGMQLYINSDLKPKPGFTDEWVTETLDAYKNSEYWFQLRPQYSHTLEGVDTTLTPHQRFVSIKDQLSPDHFLPDVMPQPI